jgi:hypothetical protein
MYEKFIANLKKRGIPEVFYPTQVEWAKQNEPETLEEFIANTREWLDDMEECAFMEKKVKEG